MTDFSKPVGEAQGGNSMGPVRRKFERYQRSRMTGQEKQAAWGALVVGPFAMWCVLYLMDVPTPWTDDVGLFGTFVVATLEEATRSDFNLDPNWRQIDDMRTDLLMMPAALAGVVTCGLYTAICNFKPFMRSVKVALKWYLWIAVPILIINTLRFTLLSDFASGNWGLFAPGWLWSYGATFWGYLAAVIGCRYFVPELDMSVEGLVRGARVQKDAAPKPKGYDAVATATKAGQIAFAGELLPREAEVKHIVALGTTGTGKSTAGYTLIRTAIDRGDRMVIADPGGDALSRFWQRDDVILNPFDARSVKWDMFAEIEEWTDYDRMAEALLPLSGSAEGDEWVGEGRTLLSCLIRSYHGLGAGTSDDFAKVLLTGGNDLWAELCEGTEAAVLFEDGNERMRGSVVNKLKPATKLLNAIANSEGRPFSVRQWVREGRGRLWLPYRINQLAALKSAIGTWFSVAILETLSLPEDRERRIWFMADELDVLGTVPDLDKGLTNGRRFGACFVLGFQSIAQLEKNYGRHLSRAIIENCSTKLILRCEVSEQGGTAEFASRLIGDREVLREEHSESYSHSGGASESTNTRQATERALLASEITQLPDRSGYLKIGGEDRWQKVEFPFNTFEAVTDTVKPAQLIAANRNRTGFVDAAE